MRLSEFHFHAFDPGDFDVLRASVMNWSLTHGPTLFRPPNNSYAPCAPELALKEYLTQSRKECASVSGADALPAADGVASGYGVAARDAAVPGVPAFQAVPSAAAVAVGRAAAAGAASAVGAAGRFG